MDDISHTDGTNCTANTQDDSRRNAATMHTPACRVHARTSIARLHLHSLPTGPLKFLTVNSRVPRPLSSSTMTSKSLIMLQTKDCARRKLPKSDRCRATRMQTVARLGALTASSHHSDASPQSPPWLKVTTIHYKTPSIQTIFTSWVARGSQGAARAKSWRQPPALTLAFQVSPRFNVECQLPRRLLAIWRLVTATLSCVREGFLALIHAHSVYIYVQLLCSSFSVSKVCVTPESVILVLATFSAPKSREINRLNADQSCVRTLISGTTNYPQLPGMHVLDDTKRNMRLQLRMPNCILSSFRE